MNFFFHELLMRERRAAGWRILTHAKPPVDEDVVYVHIAAEGWIEGASAQGIRTRLLPDRDRRQAKDRDRLDDRGFGGRSDRDGAVGRLPAKGFLKQEKIPLAPFLETRTGRLYAEQEPERQPVTLGERRSRSVALFSSPHSPTIPANAALRASPRLDALGRDLGILSML